jgi:hypothetical protein
MFLQRVAAGLVFACGAALSRLGISGESWPILAVGFGTCVAGMAWLASGPSERPAMLEA